jgi:hypothetical protein
VKDLVKVLKEFEKLYNKHIKTTFVDMTAIHNQAMKPLSDLIKANTDYWKLENMIRTGEDVPEFRRFALETEFCKFQTGICEVLKEYGTLEHHFNIAQMMTTLKIENWKNIRPFDYQLTPMLAAVNKVRDSLREMDRLGPLRIKYVIESNKELGEEIEAMVKKDNIVQVLVGDELKQDQFRFFYDTVKIIYDSALQEKLVGMKKLKEKDIEETVIPELIAYHSIMRIRNIQMKKAAEIKAAK